MSIPDFPNSTPKGVANFQAILDELPTFDRKTTFG